MTKQMRMIFQGLGLILVPSVGKYPEEGNDILILDGNKSVQVTQIGVVIWNRNSKIGNGDIKVFDS